ncbi:MAG: HAD family hydrolase [Mangrovibacterium sp.]
MMRYNILFSVGFLLLSSCTGKDTVVQSDSLNRLNWSDRNYQVLNDLIDNYGVGGQYYEENRAPYAVLDWDQTCAHFDVEEALLHYQMFHLRYKMTKEQFEDLLDNEINGVNRLSEDFNRLLLADIHQDLVNDYSFLYDHYIGPQRDMTYEEIQSTLPYQDFVAKLPYLYAGYCDTPGISDKYGYSWVLCLFAGHTIEEVKVLAREAVSYELSNRIAKVTLQSPSGMETKAGAVSYSYKSGLRIFPEMQDLINTFKDHGIDVFIVSASFKPVVEVFSGIGTFGYNVASDHVIAMELNTDQNGRILPQYKNGWVKTYAHGKVEAINKVVKTRLGRNWDPLFSAGDSDGDYEMSTEFPEMKLSLIWDRGKTGRIGELCSLARQQETGNNPRYIMQGRNENTGIAIPASNSVLFGKISPE